MIAVLLGKMLFLNNMEKVIDYYSQSRQMGDLLQAENVSIRKDFSVSLCMFCSFLNAYFCNHIRFVRIN